MKTLAALGLVGPTTLVIEDSPNGIQSAKLAQCRIAALMTAFKAQELHEAGAEVVATTFVELGRELGLVNAAVNPPSHSIHRSQPPFEIDRFVSSIRAGAARAQMTPDTGWTTLQSWGRGEV